MNAASLFFSSGKRPDVSYPSGEFYWYVASRETIDSPWDTPEALPVLLNQGGDSGPSISSDGRLLDVGRCGVIYVATRESLGTAQE